MHFPLYLSRRGGLFIALFRIPGSILDIASDPCVTAGPYLKPYDIVGSVPMYGKSLDVHACYKALQTMPDGLRFSQFVSRKSYPGQGILINPGYYYDNQVGASILQTSVESWIVPSADHCYAKRRSRSPQTKLLSQHTHRA